MAQTTDKHITVAGEALVDIVLDGTPREIPGGGPANVALGLGRLGSPVEFVTWLGDDDRGHRIAEHLQASDVRLASGVFGAERTSSATVRLADDGQPTYEFDVAWDIPPVAHAPRWLHVGSIGAFLEPGGTKVLDLVRATEDAGGTVSFDPNIRPALLGDPDDARARFVELAQSTDVLKLSDEDAAWLFPGDDTDAVLDRLLAFGVALAVVTVGSAGAVLATPRGRVAVPGERVAVVDTVGAGDTFMATLVWQLDSGDVTLGALDDAALTTLGRTCTKAAAVTVSRRGADLPTAAEIA